MWTIVVLENNEVNSKNLELAKDIRTKGFEIFFILIFIRPTTSLRNSGKGIIHMLKEDSV